MNKNSSIYTTYDINLKKYLYKNGIDNILYGLHPISRRMFWVYTRDENFEKILSKWLYDR